MGRHATFMRFALFSLAVLMRSTCCLLLRTLSFKGPGQRGSRSYGLRVFTLSWVKWHVPLEHHCPFGSSYGG
eukprot:5221695-Pleurochrysis_carterae.AAC.1